MRRVAGQLNLVGLVKKTEAEAKAKDRQLLQKKKPKTKNQRQKKEKKRSKKPTKKKMYGSDFTKTKITKRASPRF